jgi:hypothetical protein
LTRSRRRIMVVKGFSNVCVEKQWGVVGTMRNGVQNMCTTKDDVDALKWKVDNDGGRAGMVDGQAWKKSRMVMGDGAGGLCQNR